VPAKAEIVQLTKSLAIAYAADGIRVNAGCPRVWIATPLTQALRDDATSLGDRSWLETTPLGRWGTPEDVAGPVLFSCQPRGPICHRSRVTSRWRLSDRLIRFEGRFT